MNEVCVLLKQVKPKLKYLINRQFSLLLIFSIGVLCTSFNAPLKQKSGIKTIVIDAGHGGHDPGCHGKKGKEKDVTLSVALHLGKLISENCSDVKVVYTRSTDEFIELHERANIANRNKADLFISIHCNSGKGNAYGVETYSMGLHRTADNLDVAKRENSAVTLEKDYKSNYDGFDPNSPEASIIFTLYQNAFLDQSLNIASKVQDEFRLHDDRFDRGVKQAGFLVLVYTAMPSILIETGFLTSPDDEKMMITEKGQEKIAESIFRAFQKYKKDMDGDKNAENVKIEEPKVIHEDDKPADNLYHKPSKDNASQTSENVPKKDSVVIASKKEDVKKIDISPKEISVVQTPKKEEIKKVEPAPAKEISVKNNSEQNDVVFKVQVMSSDKKIPLNSAQFKGLTQVSEYTENNLFKYTTGVFDTVNDATQFQRKVREQGFKEAFVVAFFKGNRIAMKDVLQMKK